MRTQKRTPRKRAEPAALVTERTRVGNLGCIRFPLAVRKAAQIKRGHRLVVDVRNPKVIVLSRLPDGLGTPTVTVDQCACQNPGGGCCETKPYLEVGWSYVQFDAARANDLGLLPGVPLTLTAEPSRISVSVETSDSRRATTLLPLVRCPP